MSEHFMLFHMALSDQGIAEERMAARGGTDQHRSFVGHQTDRLNAIAETELSEEPLDFIEAREIAFAQFPFEADGSPAKRPRRSIDPRATDKGLPVKIPSRFQGLA
jgi:hypothetical protein